MTVIELFTDSKVDGVCHVSDFEGLADQDAYYEGLDAYRFETDSFESVGAPFLIGKQIDEALRYTYGRMRVNQTWFYFSVDSIDVDTASQCWVSYTIDAWETARYQYNARLGRGIVNRTNAVSEHPMQPHQPIREEVLKYNILPLGSERPNQLCLLAYIRADDGGDLLFMMKGGTLGFVQRVLSGSWITDIGYTATAVTIACLSPFEPVGFTNIPGKPEWAFFKDRVNMAISEQTSDLLKPMVHTDTVRDEITDMRGNVIFITPYGSEFSRVTMKLNLLANSVAWDLQFTDQYGTPFYLTMPTEPVDVFIDQYTEYFARVRSQDIATRKLQIQEQYTKGNAGAIQGGIGGAIAGASSGNAMGAVGGALIGAVSSLAGNAITKSIDEDLAPRYQAIVDRQYYHQADTLSIIGSNTASIIGDNRYAMINHVTWDAYSENRFSEDIREFGYYVQVPTSSGEDFYVKGPLAGDFEIIGVPDVWKAQIRARFIGGVKIV